MVQSWHKYTMMCKHCGSVGCYADDTTYSCTGSDIISLSDHLSSKYQVLPDFLVSNRLKLNDDKTHLMVMSTSQARATRKGTMKDSRLVVIRTPTEIIEPSETEKLLGCWLHQDMKFTEHLQKHKESLLSSLNKRIGALKMLGNVANFKTRKMIADGIIMSKLIYLIELWGGCSNYLMEALQKAQNRAARTVTKLDWNTPVGELLKECGWLSVHQLAVYHSVVLVFKVIKSKSPMYLHTMFSVEYMYKTKQADNVLLRKTKGSGLELSHDSFRWRAARGFNALPLEVRNLTTLEAFKKETKLWIKSNISLYQD